MKRLTDLIGIDGSEATASKGGYLYQDYATALAWLRLKPNELLRIEIAEDYAEQDDDGATLTQVRRVKRSLTLPGAVPFLNNVLRHIANNPSQQLTFVYLTTASVGKEKGDIFPADQCGIDLWNAVKKGAAPDTLVAGLRKLVNKGALLHEFLERNSPTEVVEKLVAHIVWAVDALELDPLRYVASEEFCQRVFAESGVVAAQARQRFPTILEHVIAVSVRETPDERVLSHKDLNELIAKIFSETLLYGEVKQLRRDAAIVASLDPAHFDKEISQRTEHLHQMRFFQETDPRQYAAALLKEVREGGALQSGSPSVRAVAMGWCARVLLEAAPEEAERALEDADSLAKVPHTVMARALKLANTDIGAAKALVAHLSSPESTFIRYAIERKASLESALDWFVESDMAPADLDEDGQFFILNDAMQIGRWDLIEQWVNKLPEPTGSCPVLRWSLGFALVGLVATPDSREAALTTVPVLGQVILGDAEADFSRRLRAATEFRRFSLWASANGLASRAYIALKYALWLELSDPDRRVTAAAEIEERRVADPESFQWTALALEAGSKFDVKDQIERLDRRLTRYGSLASEAAETLAMLLMSIDPTEWVDRLGKFSAALSEFFTPEALADFGMKALYGAGRIDEARQWIEEASLENEGARRHLLNWLDGKISGNEVAVLEQRAGADSSPLIRRQLISARERREEFEKAIEEAREIYVQSRSHSDLETVVRLLMRCERWAEIVELLDAERGLIKVPDSLWAALRIAQFNLGRWSDALKTAEDHMQESAELQEFRKQVALFSGSWDKLGVLLEQAQHDPNASPNELLQWAFIALVLDKPRVSKALTRRALAMPGADAQRHLQGYMLAVKGNWQDEPDVVHWLRCATENASDDGPVRRGSLRELVDMAPAWHEKLERLTRETAAGNLFQSVVAQAVNQPLSSLYTAVAEHNRNQDDPGQYRAIPAYSAVRDTRDLQAVNRIALDATAILSLADLDLLGAITHIFETIALSHSTGAWLFNERERTPHHQPSQVADAKKRVSRFSRGVLKVLTLAPEFSRSLAAEVGEEIPRLIASAEASGLPNWFVIQIAPVHQPNSLGEVEADVSACADQLRSLHSVIRSLYANGTITDAESQEAARFLNSVDRGWPDEELLPTKATLVLTDLALNYLEHVRLIDACAKAGFSLWVDESVREEAHAYESVEDVSQTVLRRLDRARGLVELTTNKGTVFALPKSGGGRKRAGPKKLPDQASEEQQPGGSEFDASSVHLLQSLLGDLSTVEALVIDDRAANKHSFLADAHGRQRRTMTSLDVLDILRDRKAITSDDWLYARSGLRQAGYVFIPFEREELLEALRTSAVEQGVFQESRYARVIRENHTLAQYSGLLQQPQETPWLAANNSVLRELVAEIWSGEEPPEIAAAKSDWLIELSRLDGFGSSLPGVVDQERWDRLDALRIWQFVLSLTIPEHRRSGYAEWLEENYVFEMRAQRPAAFAILVENVKEQLASIAEYVSANEIKVSNKVLHRLGKMMVGQALNNLPLSLREAAMSDATLLQESSVSRQRLITLHLEGLPSVDADQLYSLAGKSLSDKKEHEISDSSGRKWSLVASGSDGVWAKEQGGDRSFPVHHAALFSNDRAVREAYVRKLCASYRLDASHIIASVVEQASLDVLAAFEKDIEATPIAFAKNLADLLEKGAVNGTDLIPINRNYFERLVGVRGKSSLNDLAAALEAITPLSDLTNLDHTLLRSSHSTLVPVKTILGAHQSELKAWLSEHMETLDLWSLVGLVEGLLQREDLLDSLLNEATQAIELLIELLGPESERLALQAALVAHVDGWLNAGRWFQEERPFWRRMTSIAHSALIERVLVSAGVPLKSFVQWAEQAWPRFQAATLCDLPIEPRWHGYLLQPSQLTQEMVGRVMNVATMRRDTLENTPLGRVIFAPQERSLASLWKVVFAALPGPLEGEAESSPPLDQALLEDSHATLANSEQPIVERLLVVAHATALGLAPTSLLDGIVSLLRQLDASVVEIDDGQMQQLVMTLAMAAADSRHVELAKTVQDFLVHRPHLPIALRLHAAITACGAHSDESNWVGEVAMVARRMIALGLEREHSWHMLFVLRTMCQVNWALRGPLAASMARLEASSRRG